MPGASSRLSDPGRPSGPGALGCGWLELAAWAVVGASAVAAAAVFGALFRRCAWAVADRDGAARLAAGGSCRRRLTGLGPIQYRLLAGRDRLLRAFLTLTLRTLLALGLDRRLLGRLALRTAVLTELGALVDGGSRSLANPLSILPDGLPGLGCFPPLLGGRRSPLRPPRDP